MPLCWLGSLTHSLTASTYLVEVVDVAPQLIHEPRVLAEHGHSLQQRGRVGDGQSDGHQPKVRVGVRVRVRVRA